VRGGLAIAAIVVGALLAATTGVVAASVISLALISFPAMQRFGYDPRVAGGVVAATGTLTQIVPPSLVLIVVAEQLGMSLGDVYAGVLVPAALLITLYIGWILCLGVIRPHWVPAAALAQIAPGDRGGQRSLATLMVASVVVAAALMSFYPALLDATGRTTRPGTDERVIVAVGCVLISAFALALVEHGLRLQWLSPLARRVAFVLVPPLLLIFAVLGSVFLGAASPTESGALGAVAALALAWARRRLPLDALKASLFETVKLSCVVMFLLFGATVFSLSFQALEGTAWVGQALGQLPGGANGFLVIVMAVVFVLGMFLDFFELAVITLPILGPASQQFGIDPVWFAVLMGLNLQAAYLTPPFGFALFYLRGVVPHEDTVDADGTLVRKGISTQQIYWGAAPFIAIQVLVMALVILEPDLALALIDRPVSLDDATVERVIDEMSRSGQDAGR
jgi:TRAP-type mannitol/chloroaromatic compound transport system permease large subunit